VWQTFPSVPDVTVQLVIAELLMREARDRRAQVPFQYPLYHPTEKVPAPCPKVTGKRFAHGAQATLDWFLSIRHVTVYITVCGIRLYLLVTYKVRVKNSKSRKKVPFRT
jgi:hypothetical protein